MRGRLGSFAALFGASVLLQVLLFDNIEVMGVVAPYPYLIFILLLPRGTSRVLAVVLGFALGLLVDISSSTLGLHAAATTLLAYLQPLALRVLGGRERENATVPSLRQMGLVWTLEFTLLLTLAHHALLLVLSDPSWGHLTLLLLKIGGSTLLSTFIILLAETFIFAAPTDSN
ncbi:MAG: rod shape-determining protein MreD [Bacteroidia bacterium]|nr:MAG: rod shape-determining protein MreD [Bacteroidia bacterium]